MNNQQGQANPQKLMELLPLNADPNLGILINKRRVLVGRSTNCDLQIPSTQISSIHAIIEVRPEGVRVYDLNSTNGTFFEGKRIVTQDLKMGQTIRFADVEFQLKDFSDLDLPPVLDILAPQKMARMEIGAPVAPPAVAVTPETILDSRPVMNYPLAKDPKANYSEYIFEDAEHVYPIFKYGPSYAAVEVLILFNDDIISVDYLPSDKGTYYFVGERSKNGADQIELAYLPKNERFPMIEVRGGEVAVNRPQGFDVLWLKDNDVVVKKKDEPFASLSLGQADIVRFSVGAVQIFIRRTDAPPEVALAPFLRRDADFKKYVFIMMSLAILLTVMGNLFYVPYEMPKEELPERVATILYKPKPQPKIEIVKKDPPKPTPTPEPPKPKPTPKPEPVKVAQVTPTKQVQKAPEKSSGDMKSKTQKLPKKGTPAPPKKVDPLKIASNSKVEGGKPTTKTEQARKAPVDNDSKGHVDTYKSFNFSSSVSSLVQKGGTTTGVAGAQSPKGSSAGLGFSGSTVGGNTTGMLAKAQVSGPVGSLTGAVGSNSLDVEKGAGGLSSKRGVYVGGAPSQVVALGGNPDAIRKILQENIPQFRFCYQKEIDRNGPEKDVNGVVELNFIIGPTGSVARAGVSSSESDLPASVSRCVVNVLKGIKFPQPPGGGQQEVNIPFNFLAEKI